MTRLTIYGDFNCPYSALASVRVDVLLASGATYEIEWKAVQHDPEIPPGGEELEGDSAADLADEVATIAELSDRDVRLHLVVPPVRPNTTAACAVFAAAGSEADSLRRRLFAALWVEGRNLGDPAEVDRLGGVGRDHVTAARWQDEFEALPQLVTPTLVLPDGQSSPGLDALAILADYVAAAPASSQTESGE